ncbi:MAG: ExbD/TolR family protein [Oligoflexales bacterium]
MSRRHRKKKSEVSDSPIELNVMAFIDIFSLLTTFLLFTASFVSFGILEVQVPFLSNAAPEETPSKPKRTMSLNVEASKKKVVLKTEWDQKPTEPEVFEYEMSDKGLSSLNDKLITLRKQYKEETSKVTLFTEDDLIYREITEILDAIKLQPSELEGDFDTLYEKVVLGSVIL